MAMIKCPECSTNVSDKAAVCGNCGYPIAEYVREKNNNAQELHDSIKNQNMDIEQMQQETESKLSAGEFWDVKVYIDSIREKDVSNDYVKMYDAAMALNTSVEETMDVLKKNINLYKHVQSGVAICKEKDLILLGNVLDNLIYNRDGYVIVDKEGRFDFPRYVARKNNINLIGRTIDDESAFGMDNRRDKDNYFRLMVNKYSNTELEVRGLLKNYVEIFEKVEGGREIISAWDLKREVGITNVIGDLSFGRLEYNGVETVTKLGLDYAKVARDLIGYTGSLLTIEPNSPRRPMSMTAGTLVGGLIAGPVGAMVGYASSNQRNNEYVNRIEYRDECRARNAERLQESTERLSSLSVKEKEVRRYYFSYYISKIYGIKVNFFVDECDENFVFLYKGNKYYYINEFIEIIKTKINSKCNVIDKQLWLKCEKGIYLPDNYHSYKAIEKINLEQSVEEIANCIYSTLTEVLDNTSDLSIIKEIYDEYDRLLSRCLNVSVQKNKIIDKYNEKVEESIRNLHTINECLELKKMIKRHSFPKANEFEQKIIDKL